MEVRASSPPPCQYNGSTTRFGARSPASPGEQADAQGAEGRHGGRRRSRPSSRWRLCRGAATGPKRFSALAEKPNMSGRACARVCVTYATARMSRTWTREACDSCWLYVSFRSCDALGNVWSVKPRDRSVSRCAVCAADFCTRFAPSTSCERWGRTSVHAGRVTQVPRRATNGTIRRVAREARWRMIILKNRA